MPQCGIKDGEGISAKGFGINLSVCGKLQGVSHEYLAKLKSRLCNEQQR